MARLDARDGSEAWCGDWTAACARRRGWRASFPSSRLRFDRASPQGFRVGDQDSAGDDALDGTQTLKLVVGQTRTFVHVAQSAWSSHGAGPVGGHVAAQFGFELVSHGCEVWRELCELGRIDPWV